MPTLPITQIQGAKLMQPLPLAQQGVIAVGQGVIELMLQLLPQLFEAGEIHHKAIGIQFLASTNGEAAAVAMHKPAMALVVRLAVAREAVKLLEQVYIALPRANWA